MIQIVQSDGAPYALATVTALGFLGAVTLDSNPQHYRALQTVTGFQQKTGLQAESSKAVFAYGTLSPTEFLPMYSVITSGQEYYLTNDGRIYRISGAISNRSQARQGHFMNLRDKGLVALDEVF